MLILNSTDKIQVSLLNAITTSQLSCFASYRDITSTSITPLRNVLLTNSTSQVDLVASPASSTQRVIDYISVYNNDTVPNEITVRLLSTLTPYRLMVVRLAVGEKLEYQEGEGFRVIGNGYATKTITSVNGVTDTADLSMVVLKRDYVNTAITANAFIQIPELALPATAGKKYWFQYNIWYNTDSTSTGTRFNLYGVSAESFLYYQVQNTLTSTSNAIYGGLSEYKAITAANTTSAATSGNYAIIEGILVADYSDVVNINFAGDSATGVVTVKANSYLLYKQVA